MSVISLDEVDQSQVAIAGGKGANLGELIKAGFPVPPGFVVAAGAYQQLIATLDLPDNDHLPDDTEAFIEDVRQRIVAATPDPELVSQIAAQHEHLQRQRPREVIYAVRSSATAEDLADASFAGQHDTYYYVGAKSIVAMVQQCWASLWAEQAFSYRQSQNIEHRSVSMAVVVQEMVQSEISGVTFTTDPVSGNTSVIITESSWGMGAAIVDGRVTPDQYIVDKASGALTGTRIADKRFMVPPSLEAGQTSRLLEVPANLRRAESLSEAQVAAIAVLAAKSEAHFGKPQDLEWAIQDNQVFMLQSRPITVMGSSEDQVPAGKWILFKPVAENFTDPLMPLTQDLFESLIPMMKVIRGRVYMDFRAIRQLIPLKMKEQDLARLAYLSEPEDKTRRVSFPRLVLLAVLLFFNYLMMGVFSRRTANLPDDFMQGFRGYFDEVVSDDSISAPNTLLALFARYRFFEPAGHMVLLVNLVAPRYIFMLEVLSGLLKKWAPALPADTASLLCSGNEGVLSTEMGRDILGLAKLARTDEAVSQLIREQTPAVVLAEVNSAGADQPGLLQFGEALSKFLAMHGHRALKEFEISSVRWEEDPAPVVGMVRNYLLVDVSLDDAEASVRIERQRVLADAKTQLGPLRFALINRLVSETKYYIKLRENSRFYHIMGFYAVRKKILAIEQSLLDGGVMKCKGDIFYLHWQEIRDLTSGRKGWSDVEDIIRSRRMEYIRLTKIPPPKTFGFELEDASTPQTGEAMGGQGASPGHYEGIARVIMDPATDNEIEPGEILVAPYTDPAWTPLFLTANAAVIEVGSYLSHAGTIAREYGMPCVVDVAGCTSNIKTGDRIVVNGTDGSVHLVRDTDSATESGIEA